MFSPDDPRLLSWTSTLYATVHSGLPKPRDIPDEELGADKKSLKQNKNIDEEVFVSTNKTGGGCCEDMLCGYIRKCFSTLFSFILL